MSAKLILSTYGILCSHVKNTQFILSYPLADYFAFKACFAGRCLCSQNMNKYSNKPTKGYDRIIEIDFSIHLIMASKIIECKKISLYISEWP